ncbi:MAG: RNA polymerase factor sigma-54 [Gemmatimonadetes bacterium]|nr:RNA polymerase factor sigma-54 [Gemmatimonadota bacterium]MBT7860585.1 RNA polymerase factor sigma-54 [Gemmatimonadota bacterium]
MTMLRLSQGMSLQQRMAPQLIQSLQLLQMSTLELELEIKQQMEVNPLLEESMELEEEQEEEKEKADEALKEEEEVVADDFEDTVDWDALLEDQFDQNSYNNETEFDPNWEQDREPQENRITTMAPLADLLQDQLSMCSLAGKDVEIAESIIGNMDDRGYLTCTVEEVSEPLEIPIEDVERVLTVIQTFDPPGIGARNLAECLLIQLESLAGEVVDEDRQLAILVIRQHMEDLTKRRFSRITRSLAIDNQQLKYVMELIETLEPNPGAACVSAYSGLLTLDTEIPYVTPDLIVEKTGEDWIVSLTDGNLPSLRINAGYAKLMKDGRGRKDEVRTYVSKKLNDARWLINAINQRRNTMLRVANYLVRAQMPWFEHGPSSLRPMVLQDVADAVEMHVSTISRVSNGKYMQTPHGVFELKYFFDSKVSRDDGEDVSARSVKETISKLIDGEDKKKPLSDQEIAAILGRDGLKIARRTVAKYRDQLGINSQRYRKDVF